MKERASLESSRCPNYDYDSKGGTERSKRSHEPITKSPQPPALAEEGLKPCPFCGGKPYSPQPYGDFERDEQGNRIDKGTFIQCQDCGANVFRSPTASEKLIPAWNRRAPADTKAE